METPLGLAPDNLPVAPDDARRLASSEARARAVASFKAELERDLGDEIPMPTDHEIGVMVDNLTATLLLLLRLRRDRLRRDAEDEH